MRAVAAAAQRRREVRHAARAWRDAGILDDRGLASVCDAYPDDRVRVGGPLRILLGFFTVVAGFALGALAGLILDVEWGAGAAILASVLAAAFAALTDVLAVRRRRDEGGVEEAASFLGVVFAIVAAVAAWDGPPAFVAVLAWAGLVCAAACLRWGYWPYGLATAIFGFVILARLPHGRLAWVAVGAALAPCLLRASRDGRLAPSHRKAAAASVLAALFAIYLAVNVYSVENGWIEAFGARSESPSPGWLVAIAAILTIVVPCAVVAWGIRARSREILAAGAIQAACSIETLRLYYRLMPAWLLTILGGSALMAAAFALRRWLDAGPDRERGGFTAQPLFEDARGRRLAETAIALAALAPDGRKLPDEAGFKGAGGTSGGAGASGTF